ncbi:hypothetical protein HY772_06125 [Candidatus Woesearchaeota archaeon]|nr:hypothetical protein [Candidatus Woesearchaeota archaeon]
MNWDVPLRSAPVMPAVRQDIPMSITCEVSVWGVRYSGTLVGGQLSVGDSAFEMSEVSCIDIPTSKDSGGYYGVGHMILMDGTKFSFEVWSGGFFGQKRRSELTGSFKILVASLKKEVVINSEDLIRYERKE